MPSFKKVLNLGLLLVVLLAAVYILIKKSRPDAPSEKMWKNPEAELSKIVIAFQGQTTVLEKSSSTWVVTAPFSSATDPTFMVQIVDSLKTCEAGSIITDKPEKFAQFELDTASASHVTAYQAGSEKPVMDFYMGKTGLGVAESYIRLEGESAVRNATGCPSYAFRRRPEEIRLKTGSQPR